MIDGYYYLHENGSLIYKRNLDNGQAADFREGDLVRMFWKIDLKDRLDAWTILVEASALGANKTRINDLADLWHCDDADADNYGAAVGITFDMDGDAWCAKPLWFTDLQNDPAGFGATKLEAAADLCRKVGYRAQKTWGASFADLLKPKVS